MPWRVLRRSLPPCAAIRAAASPRSYKKLAVARRNPKPSPFRLFFPQLARNPSYGRREIPVTPATTHSGDQLGSTAVFPSPSTASRSCRDDQSKEKSTDSSVRVRRRRGHFPAKPDLHSTPRPFYEIPGELLVLMDLPSSSRSLWFFRPTDPSSGRRSAAPWARSGEHFRAAPPLSGPPRRHLPIAVEHPLQFLRDRVIGARLRALLHG